MSELTRVYWLLAIIFTYMVSCVSVVSFSGTASHVILVTLVWCSLPGFWAVCWLYDLGYEVPRWIVRTFMTKLIFPVRFFVLTKCFNRQNQTSEKKSENAEPSVLYESPEVYATFTDLPIEVIQRILKHDVKIYSLMMANKACLYMFAPLVYERIHGLLPLMTTRHIMENDRQLLKGEYDCLCRPPFMKSKLPILHSYKIYKRYKEALVSDYRFMNIGSTCEELGLSYNQKKNLNRTTLVLDYKHVKHICSHIINSDKSILRQFMKQFTIDLVFLDECQSRKNSMTKSLLQKYNGRKYTTTEIKPFRVFGGHELRNYKLIAESGGTAFAGELFWGDYNHFAKGIPLEKMTLVSDLLEKFRTGERAEMMKLSRKKDFESVMNKYFAEDVRLSEELANPTLPGEYPPRFLLPRSWFVIDRVRIASTHEVMRTNFMGSQFAIKKEVEELVDELSKAVSNSLENGNVSLLVVDTKGEDHCPPEFTMHRSVHIAKHKAILLNSKSK